MQKGQALIDWRRSLGKTQAEFAKMVGKSTRTIIRYERQDDGPPKTWQAAVARLEERIKELEAKARPVELPEKNQPKVVVERRQVVLDEYSQGEAIIDWDE